MNRLYSPIYRSYGSLCRRPARFLLVLAAAGLPLLGCILPGDLPQVLGERPALAAVIDDTAPESAATSRLVPGLSVPAGAFRLTNAVALEEMKTQLVTVAKGTGFELGKMEALIWGGKSHSTARTRTVQSDLKKNLNKVGYRYENAGQKKTDEGLVTFFVTGKDGANDAVLGYTVASDTYLVLAWGKITPKDKSPQSKAKTAAPAAKPTNAPASAEKPKVATAEPKRLDTELSKAVEAGKTDGVKTLLEQGADANSRFGEGEFRQAVLLRAVMRGDAAMVTALLKAGADTEYGNGRDATPLFIAAILGKADIIEALLDGGAKINGVTPDKGFTALHGAAITGKEEAAKRLLDRGAPRDARDKDGKTPLDIAAGQRNNPVAALLR